MIVRVITDHSMSNDKKYMFWGRQFYSHITVCALIGRYSGGLFVLAEMIEVFLIYVIDH